MIILAVAFQNPAEMIFIDHCLNRFRPHGARLYAGAVDFEGFAAVVSQKAFLRLTRLAAGGEAMNTDSSFLSGRVCAIGDQRFDSLGFIDAIYLPRAVAQDQIMLLRIVLTPVDKLHAQVRACFPH
jgi:hypothetical protein